MRARRNRFRPVTLGLTRLEDRAVPATLADLITPAPYTPGAENTPVNFLPHSTSIGGVDGFLTPPGPLPADPAAAAQQAFQDFAPQLGITTADAAAALKTGGYADTGGGGLYHAYYYQTLNGLPVINATAGVHVVADGRVLTLNAAFVPGLSGSGTGQVAAPAVTAAAAVADAARYFGITLATPPDTVTSTNTGDWRTVVAEREASVSDIDARLAYVNTPAGVRSGWHFNLDVPGGRNWFDVVVDAETGLVTFWADWVDQYSATYNVLPTPILDPTQGARRIQVNPYDPTASPFGWHDTNGVAGAEFTDTRGNNVNAQADPNDTNASNTRPDVGPGLVFNFPLNLGSSPANSVDASVTNLFYINNILHDTHYKYGFTEAAGNFQFNNYGKGGTGGDPVEADALDGSNIGNADNANFATPPDGFSGRMQMYIFDLTNPNRDGAFATQITVHEFGHGVSNRLTGGPANASALNATQSGGMGEGWSDFFALLYTQTAAVNRNTSLPQGTWVLNNTTGVRRYPYSYDMSIDPLTFDVYGNTGTVTYLGQPVFRSTEPHDVGEIWCSALWDMTVLLDEKYGFDKDLSTGYAPGNGPASAGNKLAYQLVMDALKLQPANPSFLDARNAILTADLRLTGGQNQREIWSAFARRGLGVGASTGDANDTTVTTNFALPAAGTSPAIIGFDQAGKTIAAAPPGSLTFNFSERMNNASFDPAADVVSFTGPNNVDLKPAITGFSWLNNNRTLQINFIPPATPAAAQGDYQLVLAPTILANDNGDSLNQNFNGVKGEVPDDRFVANFRYDALDLTATLTSIPQAGSGLTAAVVAIFNEPVSLASLGVNDLQVSQGTVTSFTVLPSSNLTRTVVRYDVAGVTTAPLFVSVKYGAVLDPYGFPVEEVNARFGQQNLSGVPFPTPLAAYGPVGWGAYQGAVSSDIGAFGEVDTYQLALDAGVNLTVIADQLAGLRAVLQVFDPDGNPVAFGTSTVASAPIYLGPFPVPVAGKYTFVVSGVSNSTGSYRLRALVGTAVEGELQDPNATNDFTPEVLDGLLTPLGTGNPTTAVTLAGNVGASSGGGPFGFGDFQDEFSFTAPAGKQVSIGVARPTGGSTVSLNVSGPGFFGGSVAASNFDRLVTFTPALGGTYTIDIGSGFGTTAGTDYLLTVLVGGALDREPNDAVGTATPISLNGSARGGIADSTDLDYYSFTIPAGAAQTVYLTSLTPGSGPNQPDNNLDPDVLLFDAVGNQIAGSMATDNAAADGRNSALTASLAPGNYRFLVRPSQQQTAQANGGDTAGEYVVQITTSANPGPLDPTAGPLNPPPTPPATGYTIKEGEDLKLSAGATDPNNDPLTFSWDLNGDGDFTDWVVNTPLSTVPWATLVALGINDGAAVFQIQVKVDDQTNPAVTSATTSLTVVNVAPNAALYIGPAGTATTMSVPEGSTAPVTLRVTSPGDPTKLANDPAATDTDPGPLDLIVGLRYAFDFDGNGLYDDGFGDGTYSGSLSTPTVTVPASVFADGDQTKVVRWLVIDKDGGKTEYTNAGTVTFTVTNVAPTLTGTAAQTDIGTPVVPNVVPTLVEGTAGKVFAVGGTDASLVDAGSLRYQFDFDLNNDGTFGDFVAGGAAYATALTTAFADLTAAQVPDGPAFVGVRVTVFDKDGGSFTLPTQMIAVANANPFGTPTAPATATEGQDVNVGIAAASDASSADLTAGLHYAYDFNNDGVFDLGDGTYANSNNPSIATMSSFYLPDGLEPSAPAPIVRTARIRVIDRNDGFTDYTVNVTVANAPPTATLSLPAAVDVGSPVAVTVTGQTDPSPVDRASPFRYSYSFNGDTIFTDAGDVQNSLTPTASFTYQTTGTKTIRVRITDKDGGFSDVVQTVVVENVQPTLFVTAPASVTEGGTATLAVSATSPSTVTTGTGFRYAFDFDGDGLFDLPAQAAGAADPTYDTAVTLTNGRMVVPAQYTADGPLTRTVRVRVFEKNGPTATPELSTDKVVTFNVLNAAPTATLTGPTGQIEVGAPVTIAFSNQADASPADAAAGFNYSFDLNNDGDFTDLNEVSGSASPSATVVFANNAVSAVRGRITDKDGAFTDYTVPVSVRTRAKIGFAAGVDAGNAPKVQLYDRDGNPSFGGLAFDPAMTAGVRVATGDFNGDGVTDIVAGTGPGVVAEVRVIDGKTGAVLFSSRPFEPEQFTGGLFVAAGDMDGDGRPEIAVSPDQGGGPRVILYRGLGFIQVNSFFGINDPAFRGGARVAMADMNGDGRADLLVSAGFMGGPRVAGFDGAGLVLGKQTKLFADFFAFEDTLRNGVYLAGGDVNGDGIADLVVGAGPGGSPRVTVYDGAALRQGVKKPMANFTTGNTDSREGVRVAVTDVDGDNLADVVTGEAGGPRANVFYGKELSRLGFPTSNIELTPFSTPMNGIFVG